VVVFDQSVCHFVFYLLELFRALVHFILKFAVFLARFNKRIAQRIDEVFNATRWITASLEYKLLSSRKRTSNGSVWNRLVEVRLLAAMSHCFAFAILTDHVSAFRFT